MMLNLRDLIGRHRTLVKWVLGSILIFLVIPKLFRFLTAERQYYPSGRLKSYRERVLVDFNFQGGRRSHGLSEDYYEDGKLAARGHAVDGLADGTITTWGPSGRKMDEWSFRKGKPKDGQRTILFDEGNTRQIITYKDKVLNGRQAMWNASGLLLDDWYYENGKPKDGERTKLSDSGRPELRTTYLKGNKNGWETVWRDNDHLRSKQFFVNGKSTTIESYDEKGLIKQREENSEKGTLVMNYENGHLRETLHFAPRAR